jgi:hypothetical protein
MYSNSCFVCHTRESKFFCLLQFICQYIFKERRRQSLMTFFRLYHLSKIHLHDSSCQVKEENTVSKKP